MSISFLNKFRSRPAHDNQTVIRDADALLREWGDAAYERATYLSWEEDFGIVAAPVAGHWWRVREEIARRLDRKQTEPSAALVSVSSTSPT
jgi:hypothetical protein